MLLRTLKLVTFDVTNTLLKFRRQPGHQYSEVGELYGLKQGMEETLAVNFRKNYKEMTEKYPNFGKNSSITWEEWWREVVRNSFKSHTNDTATLNSIAADLIEMYKTEECWKIAEGGLDLLEFLKDNDVKIGIISNFDPRLTEILNNMKLSAYFDFVLTSYDAGFLKPDAKIFAEALSRSKIENVQPNNVLHIGDNAEYDYMGAKNAGWSAVIVDGAEQKEDILTHKSAVKAEHIFANLIDLNYHMKNGSFRL